MLVAELLRSVGRLADAEVLTRRALAIAEKSLGPDDPRVAPILEKLALLPRVCGPARRDRTALPPRAIDH